MIFKIYNTDHDEGLLEKYPVLSKYGYHGEYKKWWGAQGFVFINSLEELIALFDDIKKELIVDRDNEGEPSIEIYDNWRE